VGYEEMKRIFGIITIIVLLMSEYLPVIAANSSDNENFVPKEKLLNYLREGNEKVLLMRDNYGYMMFVQNFESDAWSLYLLELTDKLIDTGAKPDKEKYMEVLLNIMLAYDLDNGNNILEQQKMDNLKEIKDYAMDFTEMGTKSISVIIENNQLASNLESSILNVIEALSVLEDNIDNWILGLSNLETILQNYLSQDSFLKLIEESSDGNLQEAAQTLRTGMAKAMQIKLDTYSDISQKNFNNYESFFFSNVFFNIIKKTSEYESDEGLKFLVDLSDGAISKVSVLLNSWDLGKKMGTLVGNVAVGGENLINRVHEMMALYEISVILQGKISTIRNEFFIDYEKENLDNLIKDYIIFSQYLIGCRIRGEYCLYSVVSHDAGLLSWFNKESSNEAMEWYESKAEKLLMIQNRLEDIVHENISNKEMYKAYIEKIEEYELEYGVGKVIKESEWFSAMTGLCFMKLVDFTQNGKEELLLVYQTHKSLEHLYGGYKFEIWGFQNGNMFIMDSGELFQTDGGCVHVYLAEVDEKKYLVTGTMDNFGYFYYHGYSNGKIEVEREVIWDDNKNPEFDCFINGESVSLDQIIEEQEKWFGNVVDYTLTYECDKVLKQNEETKQVLFSVYE
jgi:hypothetical protein